MPVSHLLEKPSWDPVEDIICGCNFTDVSGAFENSAFNIPPHHCRLCKKKKKKGEISTKKSDCKKKIAMNSPPHKEKKKLNTA